MPDQPIDTAIQPSGNGCAECEASQGWWLHLRRCARCGHIGCCGQFSRPTHDEPRSRIKPSDHREL